MDIPRGASARRPPQRVPGAGGGGRRDRRHPARAACGAAQRARRAAPRFSRPPWPGSDAAEDALSSIGRGERNRFGLRSRLRAAGLIFYFDTSALIKLVVVEDGSDLAAELWGSAYPAASSILAYPEGRAALGAAQRLDRLGEEEHREALGAFEELHAELVTIGVDQELAARAGEYAEDLELRGYDAVHLATASQLGDEEVALVTWDRDLARAAERVGLGVAGLQRRAREE